MPVPNFTQEKRSFSCSNASTGVVFIVTYCLLALRRALRITLLILALNSTRRSMPGFQTRDYTSPNSRMLSLSRGVARQTTAHKATLPTTEIPIKLQNFWMNQRTTSLLRCQWEALLGSREKRRISWLSQSKSTISTCFSLGVSNQITTPKSLPSHKHREEKKLYATNLRAWQLL